VRRSGLSGCLSEESSGTQISTPSSNESVPRNARHPAMPKQSQGTGIRHVGRFNGRREEAADAMRGLWLILIAVAIDGSHRSSEGRAPATGPGLCVRVVLDCGGASQESLLWVRVLGTHAEPSHVVSCAKSQTGIATVEGRGTSPKTEALHAPSSDNQDRSDALQGQPAQPIARETRSGAHWGTLGETHLHR
jgi:hypothetical protein